MSYSLVQELQSAARHDYANVTPAFAYINQGLRLEAPDLALEFSNGISFGRDPKGLLFYHAVSDLKLDKDMQYKVSIKRHREVSILMEEVLIIGIWSKGDDFDEVKPYAEFIAAIPNRSWGQIHGHVVKAGQWASLDLTQATCVATTCIAGGWFLVTLEIQALRKKFEFRTMSCQKRHSDKKCHGSFVASHIMHLTGSRFHVDYKNNRILIFKRRKDEDPVAVFSPLDIDIDNDEPLDDLSFQVNNGRFSEL